MIQVVIKVPEESPKLQNIDSLDELEEIMEGEYELAQDDQLPGIHILINDEARGLKPHNFTIQSDGSHDWIYGTSIFIHLEDNQVKSLTEEQISAIQDYFSKTRAYK